MKRNFANAVIGSIKPAPRQILRYFLAIFLTAVLLVSGLLYGYWVLMRDAEERVLLEGCQHWSEMYQAVANSALRDVVTDLILLANDNRMVSFIERPGDPINKGLVARFLNLAATKGRYDQVRIISAKGPELLRVDYNNGLPEVVPPARLQDKSGRYYLTDALALDPGQLYVSPLDLNVEHGKIEMPLKPMLRIATPLLNSRGEKAAILILNFLAEELFRSLRAANKGHAGSLYLLDGEGFTLMGPNPDELWGFMMPEHRPRSFNLLHADAWQRIKGRRRGQFENSEGYYTFNVAHLPEVPVFYIQGSGDENENAAPSWEQLPQWSLVQFISHGDFNLGIASLLQGLTTLFSLMVLGLLPLSWWIARMVVARRLSNAALEGKNAEFLAMFQAIPDAVAVVGFDGKITMVNDSFSDLFGFSLGEARKISYGELFAEQREVWRASNPARRQPQEARQSPQEMRCRKKGGQLFWAELAGVGVNAPSGGELGFLAIIRDVTERRQFQQTLMESETRFRTLVADRKSVV